MGWLMMLCLMRAQSAGQEGRESLHLNLAFTFSNPTHHGESALECHILTVVRTFLMPEE